MFSTRSFGDRALSFIRHHHLLVPGDDLLVAVSGGPDSVALLHILLSLKSLLRWGSLTVLHFDHQLRGEASQEDKEFVEALTESFDLPFVCRTEDVKSHQEEQGISLEMAARERRHRFFREIQSQHLPLSPNQHSSLITLGHTAQDQAEEVLLRLLRGTGPAGLAGMLPRTPQGIIRPLLFATRKEVLDYLREQNLTFRQDLSNLDPSYQRNALRLQVFPLLEQHFHHRIVETLCRHTELAQEEEDFWACETTSRWPSVCHEETPERKVLNIPDLLTLHPALQRRLFRLAVEKLTGNLLGIYAVHIEDIFKLAHRAVSGKVLQLPRGRRVIREGEKLVFLRRFPSRLPAFDWTLPVPGRYSFPPFDVFLDLEDATSVPLDRMPPTSAHRVWMDAQRIHWPLTVRSWKPGDRFHPLGLKGTKKLQDFFVDAKIPWSQRGCIPLVCDTEKICWVVGYRLDDRVKITPQTRQLLVVEIQYKGKE